MFNACLYSLTSLALDSFSKTIISSPACGTSFKPNISAGSEGLNFFRTSPLSLIIALIFPHWEPATTISPFFKTPLC